MDGNARISTTTSASPASTHVWALAFTAVTSFITGMMNHGVYFITSESFKFSSTTNLYFALAMFLPYLFAALLAGKLTRRLGARNCLLICAAGLALLAAALAAGIFPNLHPIVFWFAAPTYMFLTGILWPIVESYVSSGRHGPEMRRSIGRFNITWAFTIVFSLPVVGVLIHRPAFVFILMAVAHAASLALVLRLPPSPDSHDADEQAAHTGPEYNLLLTAARILLPLSYVLSNAFAPLLPDIWKNLGVAAGLAASLSAAWLAVRVVMFSLMYRSHRWHGRWAVLAAGGVAMILGFIAIVSGAAAPVVIAGLILYGAGQASVYYSSLYYGMAVGHADVSSGGMHEAVIGFGYSVGPILALIGQQLSSNETRGVMILVSAVTVIGCLSATRPYFAARARRQR